MVRCYLTGRRPGLAIRKSAPYPKLPGQRFILVRIVVVHRFKNIMEDNWVLATEITGVKMKCSGIWDAILLRPY
jgi:hypothetical protein